MYTKKEHIHFVGIGGIGMSGIATILHHQGYTVSGCDPDTTQETVCKLKKLGCAVYNGNNNNACNDNSIDILVYIPMYATTIPNITAEIAHAKQRNIVVISRAQMLAELMRTKYSIAIAGSHGKTTTTSLISHILIEAETDPTVIIGGNLKNISSNMRMGNGNFLVAEADESDRSFLQLHPTIAIITNIDREHLETYTDLDDIKKSFSQFLNNIPFYGKTIICIDDENIRSLLPLNNTKIITYGINYPAHFSAYNIILETDRSFFNLKINNKEYSNTTIIVPIPGIHNVYNTLAAIALAKELEIPMNTIQKSLASFEGVERRFSFRGNYMDAEIFDDYGHHPKEIENVLRVARKRAKNRLIVVFQPHRYTRTEKLWDEFLNTFAANEIDHLIITDIHSAGERPIDTITSKRLAQEIQRLKPPITVQYLPFSDNFHHIKKAITSLIDKNDLILLLGAGKIYQIAQELVS